MFTLQGFKPFGETPALSMQMCFFIYSLHSLYILQTSSLLFKFHMDLVYLWLFLLVPTHVYRFTQWNVKWTCNESQKNTHLLFIISLLLSQFLFLFTNQHVLHSLCFCVRSTVCPTFTPLHIITEQVRSLASGHWQFLSGSRDLSGTFDWSKAYRGRL